MATSENGPGHPLSLKVMRVSRPTLAAYWEPFYSSSPSFSAHSTASILSLQGKTPLDGPPKTLRDLSSTTEMLTLPASFGSIQLGETFSGFLCVNNDSSVAIESVSMKVEMQTATSKVMLAEFGGKDMILSPTDVMENVIHHEIKELGQHVLACTVMYKSPLDLRRAAVGENEGSTNVQTFRKFYKFAVTNPLSVKTKVHVSKSPSAAFSLSERDKVFLEVHIQNLTQEPMWFDSMQFDCSDGWSVRDGNVLEDGSNIFSGSNILMRPQDMRQYIYILSPTTTMLEPIIHAPGAVIPLGRLDLSWRSSYGEPGRLLTSILSRRIPLPTASQSPASALPPYLKRGSTITTPPRPRSPQVPSSRPTSPTGQRPASPFHTRPASLGPSRPQTPPLATPSTPLPISLDVTLIVKDIPRQSISVQEPFTIRCKLVVSAPIIPEHALINRTVVLAIQHVKKPKLPLPPPPSEPSVTSPGFSTPSPTYTTFNYAVARQKILNASPREQPPEDTDDDDVLVLSDPQGLRLPPPVSDTLGAASSVDVVHLGSSALVLDPMSLIPDSNSPRKCCGTQDFELTYLPTKPGFMVVGGLRVLLIEDKHGESDDGHPQKVQVIKEWDAVAEIWVSP